MRHSAAVDALTDVGPWTMRLGWRIGWPGDGGGQGGLVDRGVVLVLGRVVVSLRRGGQPSPSRGVGAADPVLRAGPAAVPQFQVGDTARGQRWPSTDRRHRGDPARPPVPSAPATNGSRSRNGCCAELPRRLHRLPRTPGRPRPPPNPATRCSPAPADSSHPRRSPPPASTGWQGSQQARRRRPRRRRRRPARALHHAYLPRMRCDRCRETAVVL
jgi:hypothetical protein